MSLFHIPFSFSASPCAVMSNAAVGGERTLFSGVIVSRTMTKMSLLRFWHGFGSETY